MKKIIIVGSLMFLYCFNSYSQEKDNYDKMIDSMLITMSRLISDDLLNDGILVLERPWIGIGESFVLEVVFDTKTMYILTMLRASEPMRKKYDKQGNLSNLRNYRKFRAFRQYISEYHTLPYDLFDYFSYRFLLLAKKGESFGDALYGEYKFEIKNKNVTIIEKKIEVLQGENIITLKYNLCL